MMLIVLNVTLLFLSQAEANSDIKMAPQHQNISASVANIQMYTCCFNPESRQKTLSQVDHFLLVFWIIVSGEELTYFY